LQSGLKNPLDLAIIKAGQPAEAKTFAKIDENPFDFVRRMMSVIVRDRENNTLLITKGAPESVLEHTAYYLDRGQAAALDSAKRAEINALFTQYSLQGYKVIAAAYKPLTPGKTSFAIEDETDLVFAGFLTFFDPPKASVKETIAALTQLGIKIKILTGDNDLVAKKVCRDVGIPADNILTGSDVDRMSDEALARSSDVVSVFARLNPVQKNRIMYLLKRKGHIVGFIGDGINDAPSLHTADVGISVNNAVDVAKEAAAMILLEKSLASLKDGVIEGRKTFANTMKYIMMGSSSNFGNMFSMSLASLMVPFLPMAPTQILLNNMLYDLSQVAIPTDRVDEESILQPQKWDLRFIRLFMLVFGPLSSVFDLLTFGLLLYVFDAGEAVFQTGWFIESLATQVLVIHIIRSKRTFLQRRAGKWLTVSTLGVAIGGFLIPYTGLGAFFGFTPVSPVLVLAMSGMVIVYLGTAELVKGWFLRKYGW
ncbi:MAG TPA: HAD-IC family P-type ATPase, partial [Negativicutes bacterium]|nr:HAD-IC family P-type ATPase [Negativicutes bacterium]